MEHSKNDVYNALDALASNVRETDNYGVFCRDELKSLIDDYFSIVDHLKQTPLWDVLTYEDRLESPVRILTTDNERLKKENNELLCKLKQSEKYMANEDIDEQVRIGDVVYSKILKTAGTVLRADPDDYIIADFDMRNGSSKRYACRWNDIVLIERKEKQK